MAGFELAQLRLGDRLAPELEGRDLEAIRFTWAVAAPSDTFGARLNEIVTDAICPECAMLSGPVRCSKVATSVSGIALPLPGLSIFTSVSSALMTMLASTR